MVRSVAESTRALLPGIVICATVASAASFLSEHHGGPTLIYSLLIGMSLHFLSEGTMAAPGIQFVGRTVLRAGIAMLGVRISAGQVLELGLIPISIVAFGVLATLMFGRYAAPLFRVTTSQGILSGGAVAICGASAALAISAVLPRTKDTERNALFTIISVTILSTIAMVVYPIAVRRIGLSEHAAGILLGGTIHDVAQVIGAGYLISDQAGIVATYVKLLRVAALVPVVMVLAWMYAGPTRRTAGNARPILPAFLVAFALFAAVNSVGLVSGAAADGLGQVSRWCLVCAIAALGMGTSLRDLATVGWRPLGLVVCETIFLLVFVLVGLWCAGMT
jgi:uncharacterized integral membrane protein (TIGR00698 family)